MKAALTALLIVLTAAPAAAQKVIHQGSTLPWAVACLQDEMTDKISCNLWARSGESRLFVRQSLIAVTGPRGVNMLLRIDQKEARPFGCCIVDGPMAKEVIAEMRAAKTLRVRVLGGRGPDTDLAFDMTGLVAAIVERDAACQRFKATTC